ncbi:MAG: DUF4910 domain-containing protein [Acidobacteriota bacterium]
MTTTSDLDFQALGDAMYRFAERAYPLCRSITGDGVRQTLELVRETVPELAIHEVPSGEAILDWTVPEEWNLRGARLIGPDGRVIVDSADHNLHVMGYSEPVDRRLSLDELQGHLFSLPDQPEAIPYRTSYWKRGWAFCLPHRVREALPPGEYRAVIDATLGPGSLTYGEVVLDGERGGGADELVLISAHTCHPSLANDNLSGLGVVAQLARHLADRKTRRFGYRLLFAPGTIGAITWLARNKHDAARRVRHGLIAANLGDAGPFHFKRSEQGQSELDRSVEYVLRQRGVDHRVTDFEPFGYDERQYCSPGFDLPVGLLSRAPWGSFPEYHTSGDNLSLIGAGPLARSLELYVEIIDFLEANRRYRNLAPHAEPQLGRRGLYHHIGGGEEGRARQLALLWVLNQSRGDRSLLDIAERSGLAFNSLAEAAAALLAADLLEPA